MAFATRIEIALRDVRCAVSTTRELARTTPKESMFTGVFLASSECDACCERGRRGISLRDHDASTSRRVGASHAAKTRGARHDVVDADARKDVNACNLCADKVRYVLHSIRGGKQNTTTELVVEVSKRPSADGNSHTDIVGDLGS